MKQAITHTAENIMTHRAILTLSLFVASGVCAIWYAFSLYSLISHTVAIRQTDKQIAAVSSAVSDLNVKYLKLTSNITPDSLSGRGFTAGKVAAYIKRSQPTASALILARAGHEL